MNTYSIIPSHISTVNIHLQALVDRFPMSKKFLSFVCFSSCFDLCDLFFTPLILTHLHFGKNIIIRSSLLLFEAIRHLELHRVQPIQYSTKFYSAEVTCFFFNLLILSLFHEKAASNLLRVQHFVKREPSEITNSVQAERSIQHVSILQKYASSQKI